LSTSLSTNASAFGAFIAFIAAIVAFIGDFFTTLPIGDFTTLIDAIGAFIAFIGAFIAAFFAPPRRPSI